MEGSIIKKAFITTIIISLILSALEAIFIFLFRKFGEIEIRILLTTLSIGAHSIAGLIFSILYEKRKLLLFSISGLGITIFGFIINVLYIWKIVDGEFYYKTFLIFSIILFSSLHASLILLVKSEKNLVNIFKFFTIFMISIVTIMLIILVLSISTDLNLGEWYYRILGVMAVLDGLGTILTLIFSRFIKE